MFSDAHHFISQWLRKYSLSKMKLDLNKLITGPETKFSGKNVKVLHKTVESRFVLFLSRCTASVQKDQKLAQNNVRSRILSRMIFTGRIQTPWNTGRTECTPSDFCMLRCRVFSMFPTVTVGGTVKYLQLRPSELQEYEAQVERVLDRYIKRLQWLLAGE